MPGRECLRVAVTVRVLLFASWSEAIGARSGEVEVAEGAPAADVVSAVESRARGARLPRPAVAVNRRIVAAGTRVDARDEIAIVPPVAGG